MNLECPHCHTTFEVDEKYTAALVQQVRNAEFEKELEHRIEEIEERRKAEEKVGAVEAQRIADRQISDKNEEILTLKQEIEKLKGEVRNSDVDKKAALAEAATESLRKINELASAKDKEITELTLAKNREFNELSNAKDKEINELNLSKDREINELKSARLQELNELREAKDKEINDLKGEMAEINAQLKSGDLASKNKELELREHYNLLLTAKDEEIERYKDMKVRLSTKMLGETLEQHCRNAFNQARSYGQFPNAYFEKDNDASGGTKGDFIFRDYIEGQECISIMFEMKNEADTTATKHRNEDFFPKLDKDRREKNCEYAVLVSMLEADNDLYNQGIVDVSYRYDKMFVVRPQFFMPIISLLSRASMRGAQTILTLRRELDIAKAQSIDVTNFEARRDKFVAEFGKLVEQHLKKQDSALEGIDKAIEAAEKQAENLRKIKQLFETSRQKLIKANEVAENDFTIKKLTRGNPTMKKKFDDARKAAESAEELGI